MNRLKKGDNVFVIAGKDKGRQGTVVSVTLDRNRIIVKGINLVKKYIKPDPNKHIEGGILEQEASFDVSNVALYNPVKDKRDRVGFKFVNSGNKKVRYFKSNGELIDL